MSGWMSKSWSWLKAKKEILIEKTSKSREPSQQSNGCDSFTGPEMRHETKYNLISFCFVKKCGHFLTMGCVYVYKVYEYKHGFM